MISVFAVVLVEMFFAMKGAGHVHGTDYETLMGEIDSGSMAEFRDDPPTYVPLEARNASNNIGLEATRSNNQMENSDPTSSASPDLERSSLAGTDKVDDDDDADLDDLDPYADNIPINGWSQSRSTPFNPRHRSHMSGHHRSNTATSDLPMQNPQRALLQCLLLEAGILFHSIFIGMALSVATGASFVVLLIAISFHQTFEGFALGARIASLIPDLFPASSMKPWFMSLAYGTTTPVGQAIGLVLHNFYDPASTTGLLMVGITNAISSGLLLFAGLVELLAEDFLSESSYETLKGRRRVEACISVACGALLMAFVGAFA